jgi:uncharacterized membrane protein
MTITFWKHICDRQRKFYWKILIPQWMCTILSILDVDEWLWVQGVWYGGGFLFVYMFLSCLVIVLMCLSLYSMRVVSKHQNQMLQEMRLRHERDIREMRDRARGYRTRGNAQ